MTVYDRLREWQVLPQAYEDWKGYRGLLTNRILRLAEEKSCRSLRIIGAGGANDYDLRRLSGAFDRIFLLDRDRASMEAGLLRQQADPAEFILEEEDLLGVSDGRYQDFCALLQGEVDRFGRDTDIHALSEMALSFLEEAYEEAAETRRKALPTALPETDAVVISGVHSQLNHMFYWIWDAYSQALGKQDARVGIRVMKETEGLVKELHDRLLAKEGQIMLLSMEQERIGVPGGIQGAEAAIRDIHMRAMRGEVSVSEEEDLLWPFDVRKGIAYSMKVITVQNRRPKL